MFSSTSYIDFYFTIIFLIKCMVDCKIKLDT